MSYSTDLTDQEWEIIEPLLPKKRKTNRIKWNKRIIFNAILYQLKNGCNWRDLPKDFPPYQTVYDYYSQWRKDGTFDKLGKFCHQKLREQVDKNPHYSSLIMVDSQAVKNTCTASKDTSGFCLYKATNGIKRHLAVDSLGFPFLLYCSKASLSDDQGLIEMFKENINFFKLKPMNTKKITILVDRGYHPNTIMTALKEIYPAIDKKIKFKVSEKISPEEKKEKGLTGFVPEKMRWIIERSNAWVERCKSLIKNFESTLKYAETRLSLCFTRLMLIRLAAG
ncbi:MAG: IS5 family transposase [Synechococcaceae cyanobacterium SM2_3_1]|nr:IS5 family transposase [Synechococcaceae cyanobacterium SM2_3_1]